MTQVMLGLCWHIGECHRMSYRDEDRIIAEAMRPVTGLMGDSPLHDAPHYHRGWPIMRHNQHDNTFEPRCALFIWYRLERVK